MYDIKSKEQWQQILDRVSQRLGMPSAITDKENNVLQVSGRRNSLCSKIRSIEEASSFICSQAQQFMAEEAREKRKPLIDYCDAGMLKLVIPVFSETGFLGTLTACGARIEGQEIEAFLIEKTTKASEAEIEALARHVRDGDRSKISEFAHRLHRDIHNGAPP
jgi:ligand-binding sensor protein